MQEQETDLVKLEVTLKSGEFLELTGSRAEAYVFHRRFLKFVDQQIHKTDNHRLLLFGNNYVVGSEVAAYSAVDIDGRRIRLGEVT